MTPQQRTLIAAVADRCGAAAAVTDPAAIAPWTTDWRDRFHGRTPAILAPATTAQAAFIVAAAHAAGVPLVPQGGNSSMVGGATPPADGSALILSLRRLDRIRSLDAAAGLAVVEAGVILADLHEAALAAGRRFPLTLGARGSCTVGGLTATNAGGTQVLRWGTMRALVAGVEAVLSDGAVHDGLSALKKDNRGYDLTQLLIGSEGTLGVITAVTVRLAPATAGRAVAWLGLADPQAALDLLRRLQAATDRIESFELIEASILANAQRHVPGVRLPLGTAQPWQVLVEAVTLDPADEPAEALLERLLAPALADGAVADAVIAASEAQAEAFWRIRDSLSDAERAAGPATQYDISVPVAALPRFVAEAARTIAAAYPGVAATAFGHLGDGNLHFHVRAGDRPGFADDAPAITRLVHDLVTAAGGSLSAEHGIGQMKRAELARLGPPARLAALAAIKRALDPAGILNPGKLI